MTDRQFYRMIQQIKRCYQLSPEAAERILRGIRKRLACECKVVVSGESDKKE